MKYPLKAPGIHMKSAMKYLGAKNEISIESARYPYENCNHGAKNEISIESARHLYEKHNEISIESTRHLYENHNEIYWV